MITWLFLRLFRRKHWACKCFHLDDSASPSNKPWAALCPEFHLCQAVAQAKIAWWETDVQISNPVFQMCYVVDLLVLTCLDRLCLLCDRKCAFFRIFPRWCHLIAPHQQEEIICRGGRPPQGSSWLLLCMCIRRVAVYTRVSPLLQPWDLPPSRQRLLCCATAALGLWKGLRDRKCFSAPCLLLVGFKSSFTVSFLYLCSLWNPLLCTVLLERERKISGKKEYSPTAR